MARRLAPEALRQVLKAAAAALAARSISVPSPEATTH